MKNHPMILVLSSVVLLLALPCRTLAQSLDELIAQRDQLVARRSALQGEANEYLLTYDDLTNQYNALVAGNGSWSDLWDEYRGLLMALALADDRIQELREQLDEFRQYCNERIAEFENELTEIDNKFNEEPADSLADSSRVEEAIARRAEIQMEMDAIKETLEMEEMFTEYQIECINSEKESINADIAWYESMMDNFYAYQSEAESIEDQRSYVNGEINSRNQEIAELNQRIHDLNVAISAW